MTPFVSQDGVVNDYKQLPSYYANFTVGDKTHSRLPVFHISDFKYFPFIVCQKN